MELDNIQQYHLTAEDWQAIHKLSDERYKKWEWNYGKSPAFNLQKVQRFAAGEIDARLEIEKGIIRQVKFFGDFFGKLEISKLEEQLKGVRYHPDDLRIALEKVDVSQFFSNISMEDLLWLLY